jgi:hypothetical protein
MKKGTIAIFCGAMAFILLGLLFVVSAGAFGIILGLIVVGVGIVIMIGGYQDKKRLEKLDKLKSW